MSFAGDAKLEIVMLRPKAKALREAQAYGLFAFGRAFSPDEVSLATESLEIAKLYRDSLRRYSPRGGEIQWEETPRRDGVLYRISLPREPDRKALISRIGGSIPLAEWCSEEQLAPLVSGAFLACGNVSDPEKSYHLEFAVREQPLAEELGELLEGIAPGGRVIFRRGAYVLYYKECGQIEDILTLMGASRACLTMIDVEMLKEVRNQAMRATNCETANIDKTVKAASGQTADIQLILERQGLESLPDPLQEAALLRLEHPELSLRELAEVFPTPISRSGVHHRLAQLGRIAAKIREEEEGR